MLICAKSNAVAASALIRCSQTRFILNDVDIRLTRIPDSDIEFNAKFPDSLCEPRRTDSRTQCHADRVAMIGRDRDRLPSVHFGDQSLEHPAHAREISR